MLWRILLAIILVPVLSIALVALVLYFPPVQRRAVSIAENILREKTGLAVSVGQVGISPIADIDLHGISLLDNGADTLIAADDFILRPDLHAIRYGIAGISRFRILNLSANTKELIPGIEFQGKVGRLDIVSDSTSFADARTIVNEVSLEDLDLTINLPVQNQKDTTSDNDTSPFAWFFDVRTASIQDAKVRLNPIELDVDVSDIALSGTVDIGHAAYHADSFASGPLNVGVAGKRFSLDEASLVAAMDSTFIRADRIHIRKGGMTADVEATLDLADLQSLAYSVNLDMGWSALSDIIPYDVPVAAKGSVSVRGRGFDITDNRTKIDVKASIDSCATGPVRTGPTLLSANIERKTISGRIRTRASYADTSLFAAISGVLDLKASDIQSKRPSLTLNADLDTLSFCKDSIVLNLDTLAVDASTRIGNTDISVETGGFSVKTKSSLYFTDLLNSMKEVTSVLSGQLDSTDVDIPAIRRHLPELTAFVKADRDNPAESIISRYGIAFETFGLDASLSPEQGINAILSVRDISLDTLSLHSADVRLSQADDSLLCGIDLDFLSQYDMPDIAVGVDAAFSSHSARARLKAKSEIRDGTLGIRNLNTGLDLDIQASLDHGSLDAEGSLVLDSLKYASADFGTRTVTFRGSSPDVKHFDLSADTDNVPLSVIGSFVNLGNLALTGEVLARVSAKGSLDSLEIAGEVVPDGITVGYAPFDAQFALGDVPICLEDEVVRISNLPVYAVDSTCAVVDGTLNLSDMAMDIGIRSDRFKPLPLEEKDSIPYFGNVAAGLDVMLAGTPDKLDISGDVTVLPETEVTYNIDRKNYVHVKPSGKVSVKFPIGGDILLNGRIDVRQGVIRYSPPYYPFEPFTIDPESNVTFNGPLDRMALNVAATQRARAIVGDVGDRTKEVDFIVGVKVINTLSDLGLGFIISAPNDAAIQKEIAGFSDEDRDRIAVTLLATGMYVSETNTALNKSGYAVTSILQRGANALAGNALGKYVDLNFGAGTSRRNGMLSTDYTMALSKSFFDDRLRLTVGGRVSDMSGSGQKSQSAIDNISADWRLKKGSKTTLSLFHKKDYENIVDGELDKDGIGIRTGFDIRSAKDSVNPFRFDVEGNVSYRSNSQFGPDLSVAMTKFNLLKLDELISAKVFGAYYWKMANRTEGSTHANDNFDLGFDASASFPKIFFPGFVKKKFEQPVSTSFNIGYMYENIAAGCVLNKVSLGADYGFRTSKYVSHDFSPLNWTLVLTVGDLNYYDKLPNKDNLIKSIADNTNTISIGYNFRYNNTFETSRAVTTRLEAGVKESAILLNSIIKSKPFDEYVKFNAELRNRFRVTDVTSFATRVYAGAAVPVGGGYGAPLADLFYIGGPNSIRAFAPRSIGPGEFHSDKYDMYMYHSGEIKFEANVEYRFPLFWMLEGAVFVDAGNVWNIESVRDRCTPDMLKEIEKALGITYNFDDGIKFNKLLQQIALGSGFGVRFVFQSIVARLDLGIAIHAPYDTGKSGYYNIPNFFKDGMRLNFGIGYPF